MRRFSTSLAIIVLCTGSVQALQPGPRTIRVDTDDSLSPPVKHALADLERALRARNLQIIDQPDKAADARIYFGTAKNTKTIGQAAATVSLSEKPEALFIRKQAEKSLLLGGRDERGLSYALREAARAIETAPADGDLFAGLENIVEEPYLNVRSMTVHLFNEDVEKDWYHSEKYWRGYFSMLAGNRYNQFTLTFGDQTNYLNPLYAYLLDVPGYPKVSVKGVSAEAKRRNLAMLKRIAELAVEYGIDFNLGIWMQMPEPRYAGKILVDGLPPGLEAAKYCGEGLRMILQACPAISGVQFRMNDEAGIPEAQQTEFFRPIFEAVRACGRHIRVDLRYKGLRPATLQLALEMGLDVTVSTKFWCEHMGLPFHPTEEDTHYRQSRYGYGAMLSYPRSYKVMYRLWSVGTQRLLLWGDPDYAAKFARSCRLGDGQGFEVFAPLTNKGYGNAPGNWAIHNPEHRHYEWEYQRYWAFYQAFGRMGFNPETKAEVWQREFRQRFGPAATDLESAYRHASQVLPLITATHLPSASEWSWWPEMDTGDRLPEYMRAQPSDRGQFYAIRSWQATPQWRTEAWDDFVPGFVEDALAGKVRGKWTPIMVSQRLQELAASTLKHLDEPTIRQSQSADVRGTRIDLRIVAELAKYHAEKMLAATHYGFFDKTGEVGRLPIALRHLDNAEAAWQEIVDCAEFVFHDDLVFGTTPETARNKFGHHHSKAWHHRWKEVKADVKWLSELARTKGSNEPFTRYPGEAPLKSPPQIEHTPLQGEVLPSDNLPITVRVRSEQPVQKVILHFRAVNQMADWKEFAMKANGEGRYEAVISSKEITAQWDYMYYVEALVDGGGRLWPSWEEGQPYVVVRVKR